MVSTENVSGFVSSDMGYILRNMMRKCYFQSDMAIADIMYFVVFGLECLNHNTKLYERSRNLRKVRHRPR